LEEEAKLKNLDVVAKTMKYKEWKAKNGKGDAASIVSITQQEIW
jgi:hypothetical protein